MSEKKKKNKKKRKENKTYHQGFPIDKKKIQRQVKTHPIFGAKKNTVRASSDKRSSKKDRRINSTTIRNPATKKNLKKTLHEQGNVGKKKKEKKQKKTPRKGNNAT